MRDRKLVAGLVVLVVVLGGSAVAFAETSGGSGEVHACVTKSNGYVRIVRDGDRCRRSERAETWSREGPQGATGAPGPAGPAGPQGERGEPGASGGGSGVPAVQTVGRITISGIAGGPDGTTTQIPITSLAGGVTSTGASSTGGGGGVGKATFAPITIGKAIDAATPLLAVDVANGRHLQQVVIDLCTDADCADGPYFTQVLRDVLVTGATNAAPGGSDHVLLEQVTLAFNEIEWRYHKADGSGDVVGTWNIADNRQT